MVSVAKGDVIIHLPKTLHGSTTNAGAKTRKAWILHFSPYGRYEPVLPTNLAYYFGKKITLR
jgi:ectoine hydroxylase-related dioxygenase (phytanoyl-CoA dioxygenase family)